MKKLGIVIMSVAVVALLAACGGGKSGSSASGDASESNESGLVEGKWPAAIYDKYGIPEIETKGKIVYTELSGNEDSYLYRVFYNGVTKEEMQAYVKKLQDKGFRVPKYTQERIDAGRRDFDAFLFQPKEEQDIRLRMTFDFENPMSFEFYEDEPNPAFEVVERDGESYIDYNFELSLNRMKNQVETEGSIEALNLKAEDMAGIPHVRVVSMGSGAMGSSMDVAFYPDHQLTEESFAAVHKKVLEVLTAKGCKFSHAFSGKEMTPEQLSAEGIHSYGVKLNDQQFLMMTMCDDRVGDFGGSIKFMFNKSRK